MREATEPLRLLFLGDSDDAASLALDALRQSGLEVAVNCVHDAHDLEVALVDARGSFDVIVCDVLAPDDAALAAATVLGVARRCAADVPVIVRSHVVAVDVAVEVMRAGAADYLAAGDLARLGPAVSRALGDRRERAELRRADHQREQSEASFRLIVESSPELVVVHRDGVVVYANPRTVERLGWTDEGGLVGRALSTVVLDEDRRSVRPAAQPEGERSTAVAQRWQRNDGSVVAVEIVQGPVVFEGALATVVVARDVTERNHVAARMIEMDRMAAIGILAAGVGHEINNPLAYVLANLEFVTAELALVSSLLPRDSLELLTPRMNGVMQALEDTNHGAQRVRDIVADLRTFSRGDDESIAPVDVRRLLDSSLRMASVQLRQCATVEKRYARELASVLASESRLGQLFLNLVVNAAQAMPEGNPGNHHIVISVSEEDRFVRVEVADSGAGIPADVLPRIFEPFFTTKPAGQGTGLGLSISRRTVEQLGGSISVESQPGVGTRFVVRLPRAEVKPERRPSVRRPPPPTAPKRATILCVDDEPALGLALKRVLVDEHDVVVTTNAADALARVMAGEHFDLLLCDLMMPGMTGMDLHDELLRTMPHLAQRMVFVTGGAFTTRALDFLEGVGNPRLAKPVRLDALRAVIAGSLAAA